jgi:hypothetical protein
MEGSAGRRIRERKLARAMMQASSTLAHHADGGSLALFVAPLGQDVAKAKQMRPWF